MAFEVFGGLAAENFSAEHEPGAQRIEMQQRLFEERFIQGVQIRVGHDYTNKLPLAGLIQRITELEIPYIVHGPAENLGVDIGECFDEVGTFSSFQKEHPDRTWRQFNQQAISTAAQVAQGRNSLDARAILHTGYSPADSRIRNMQVSYVIRFLQKELAAIPVMLEAIPALVITEDTAVTHYGFGGTPEEMQELLGPAAKQPSAVLLDFTHVGVTANQMAALPYSFPQPRTYEKLLAGFLELGVSRFTHFSGHTSELWDVHDGFLLPRAQDAYKESVVRDALQELERRYAPQPAVIALEMRFTDRENSKREIDAFRNCYFSLGRARTLAG